MRVANVVVSVSVVHLGRARCGQARRGRGSPGRACRDRDRLDEDATASVVTKSVTAAIAVARDPLEMVAAELQTLPFRGIERQTHGRGDPIVDS